jgi:hypothetical protein
MTFKKVCSLGLPPYVTMASTSAPGGVTLPDAERRTGSIRPANVRRNISSDRRHGEGFALAGARLRPTAKQLDNHDQHLSTPIR